MAFGTRDLNGAGGERGTGLSGQGCRLLGLLHEHRGALDMMDDHRGGGHHLGSDGGVLGIQCGRGGAGLSWCWGGFSDGL